MQPIVEGVKTMYGVQKVNIIAHSMGGLWSREYALNDDPKNSVDNLIMLGTPNRGSFWADASLDAYVGCLVGQFWPNPSLQLGCSRIIQEYQGRMPAITQLTTQAVEDYNSGHGAAPCVDYYVLAARVPELESFASPNDGVVSVDSVQALPYATALPAVVYHQPTPNTSKPWNNFVHNIMPLEQVFQTPVAPLYWYTNNHNCRTVETGGSGIARPVTAAPAATPAVARWSAAVGLLESGQTQTIPVQVDNADSVSFLLNWTNPTSTLSLTLQDPAGQMITPTGAYAGSNYAIGYAGVKYSIQQPLVGTWQIVVAAGAVPSDGEAFSLGGEFTGGVQLNPSVSSTVVSVNQPITISTMLQDAAPITGAVVTASIALLPNGAYTTTLPLVEQPGGMYRGVFTPSTSGVFAIGLAATGRNNLGQSFDRRSSLRVQASSGATLTGSFAESAYDSQGSGQYDSLAISPTLIITQAAQYRVSGQLTTTDGRMIAFATSVYTPGVGTVQLPLRFNGSDIGSGSADGPYQLVNLTVAQIISDELTVAAVPAAYTTNAYSRYAWVRPNVVQTGPATDQGVDLNSNGLFDALAVTIPLDVRSAGYYNASLNLLAGDGTTITTAQVSSQYLDQGANTLTMRFDGPTIQRTGKDGPYRATDLLIMQSSGVRDPSTVLLVLEQSQPYRATDFDLPPPTPTPTGTATPTVTVTPTATPAPDFLINVSPSSQSVSCPGSATYTVTLTSVGSYSGSVSLTISGVPKGTTANFSPNPVALPAGAVRTAQLTITTTNSTPQYLMNLTVTGSDGTRSHSQIVSLNPQ